jgi:chromate transporter
MTDSQPAPQARSAPRIPRSADDFIEALRFWFKLGFISFGGPAGQIAIMHQELVERRRWISEHRFLHALNYCMLLPGPEACQLAIYTGWLLHGLRGGLMAGLLFFLPAFFLLSLLAGLYLAFGDLPSVQGIFYGIKPAVVAVVLFAAWRIGSRAIKNGVLLAIAAAGLRRHFLLQDRLSLDRAGRRHSRRHRRQADAGKFTAGGGHGAGNKELRPGADRRRHAAAAAREVLLGQAGLTTALSSPSAPLSLLALRGSADLYHMGEFFTKAAFLTIGGAYAVLPYVYQGGVEHYGWLTGPQMMDGLALGETTPGPLIMIVTWVGYVGGVTKVGRWAGPSPRAWPVRRWRPSSPSCPASVHHRRRPAWSRPRAANSNSPRR